VLRVKVVVAVAGELHFLIDENLFFFACFDETIGTLVDNDEGGHGNNEPMAKGSENDERGV
jgi:hypothetical protein